MKDGVVRKSKYGKFWIISLIIVAILIFYNSNKDYKNKPFNFENNGLRILSSPDNAIFKENIESFAKKNGIDVDFTFKGDLEIVDELNINSKEYDAVWISNSMWLYMLNNSYLISDSKSVGISPIVLGIKKSKAESLNLVNGNISNNDILDLIENKKINYVMSSVTSTNTGATAYLGFLHSLANNPEILTEEMLDNEELKLKLTNFFSGVERVSGDESYLEEMFVNSDTYEAIIASESSLININQKLKNKNKEQLYLIYPIDGVALNDSTFAFIDNKLNLEDDFLSIQNYLLSDDGKKMLENNGLRTWYGGTNNNADKEIFDVSLGIDTSKFLKTTKFPSKKVISKAINIYIEELRKPTHVVFCLDYSGSMYGKGESELENAMNYILDYNEASKDKLQFSKKDKITVIPFDTRVRGVMSTNSGYETSDLIKKIYNNVPNGSTALYDAIIEGLNILNEESDDYTKTIIAMTDGYVNVGSYASLSRVYHNFNSTIPIYSIMFGDASNYQLNDIAVLSNAKVFDGKTNLLEAFKQVRGYN